MTKNKALLQSCRRGILALHGVEGYPYAIPINYLYVEKDARIIFHGAKAGHKVDALQTHDKVCFTVYGHETIKDEPWAPYLQSVVAFGRCQLIEDQEKAMTLLKTMALKYYPSEALVLEEIAANGKATQMFQIDIDHISGKEVQEK